MPMVCCFQVIAPGRRFDFSLKDSHLSSRESRHVVVDGRCRYFDDTREMTGLLKRNWL